MERDASMEPADTPGLDLGTTRWYGAALFAGVAHVLAWTATLFLAFGPIYQGVSSTETLLEANGLSALPLLIAPLALTALVTAIAVTIRIKTSTRRVSLWVAAVLLLLFCAAGIFSIGIFYLPAAVALVVAAIVGSRGAPARAP